MKESFSYLILLIILFISSCKGNHDERISAALTLVENDKPDSALMLLKKIGQPRLSDRDLAMYSLVFTMAQDRSGIDIDNDSLLRSAYTYYNIRPNDSLYAKCEYYMGKYYMLNDSTEIALDCLQKAADAAEK